MSINNLTITHWVSVATIGVLGIGGLIIGLYPELFNEEVAPIDEIAKEDDIPQLINTTKENILEPIMDNIIEPVLEEVLITLDADDNDKKLNKTKSKKEDKTGKKHKKTNKEKIIINSGIRFDPL
jgi:hypothetical protein